MELPTVLSTVYTVPVKGIPISDSRTQTSGEAPTQQIWKVTFKMHPQASAMPTFTFLLIHLFTSSHSKPPSSQKLLPDQRHIDAPESFQRTPCIKDKPAASMLILGRKTAIKDVSPTNADPLQETSN